MDLAQGEDTGAVRAAIGTPLAEQVDCRSSPREAGVVQNRVEGHRILAEDRRVVERTHCSILGRVPPEDVIDNSPVGCSRIVSDTWKVAPRVDVDSFVIPRIVYNWLQFGLVHVDA